MEFKPAADQPAASGPQEYEIMGDIDADVMTDAEVDRLVDQVGRRRQPYYWRGWWQGALLGFAIGYLVCMLGLVVPK